MSRSTTMPKECRERHTETFAVPSSLAVQAGLFLAERRQMVLQGAAFALDFLDGPHTEAAQQGNGRTPALDGVLQKEALNQERDEQPAAVAGQAEREAQQCQRRGHRFDVPLDIPFQIKRAQPAMNRWGALPGYVPHSLLRLPP